MKANIQPPTIEKKPSAKTAKSEKAQRPAGEVDLSKRPRKLAKFDKESLREFLQESLRGHQKAKREGTLIDAVGTLLKLRGGK